MAVCKKCKTVLVVCPDCNGTGKRGPGQGPGQKCPRCRGTGKICHIHGGDHGN